MPQQSQTSNHDHLACETVTGGGSRLQLVLNLRAGLSSSVFPVRSANSEHRALAPPPPLTALSRRVAPGDLRLSDLVTTHRRHLPTGFLSLSRHLSQQLEFQCVPKTSTRQKHNPQAIFTEMLSETMKRFSSRLLFASIRLPRACYYLGSPPKKS